MLAIISKSVSRAVLCEIEDRSTRDHAASGLDQNRYWSSSGETFSPGGGIKVRARGNKQYVAPASWKSGTILTARSLEGVQSTE
jgi:hypothetical protein